MEHKEMIRTYCCCVSVITCLLGLVFSIAGGLNGVTIRTIWMFLVILNGAVWGFGEWAVSKM